jgi:TolA-binding protein
VSTELTAIAIVVAFTIGALSMLAMDSCVKESRATQAHAMGIASHGAGDWINPGIECLNRETSAAQSRTQQLWQKQAELETQIDVMSGAYELRQQLESEPEDKAIKHALAVLKGDAIYEQSRVARKFLRDRDRIIDSGIKPTQDEIVEHEMRRARRGNEP